MRSLLDERLSDGAIAIFTPELTASASPPGCREQLVHEPRRAVRVDHEAEAVRARGADRDDDPPVVADRDLDLPAERGAARALRQTRSRCSTAGVDLQAESSDGRVADDREPEVEISSSLRVVRSVPSLIVSDARSGLLGTRRRWPLRDREGAQEEHEALEEEPLSRVRLQPRPTGFREQVGDPLPVDPAEAVLDVELGGDVVDVLEVDDAGEEQCREDRWVVVLEQADDEMVRQTARQLGEDVRVRQQARPCEVGLQARLHDRVHPGERAAESDGELGQRHERGLVVLSAHGLDERVDRRHHHPDAAAELVQSGELGRREVAELGEQRLRLLRALDRDRQWLDEAATQLDPREEVAVLHLDRAVRAEEALVGARERHPWTRHGDRLLLRFALGEGRLEEIDTAASSSE